MNSIVLPKNFDISKLTYGTPKALESGGKSIYILYDGKPLVMQTPEMPVPFGMSKWAGDGKSADKYTLNMSFKNMAEKPSLKRFHDIMEALDDKLITDATVNSAQWLKKKYTSTEIVKELYTPIVRVARDKETGDVTDKYPPTFRCSVPCRNGTFTCEVYDKQRNPLDLNTVETKGSRITAIVAPTLWVAGGRFGCTFRVVQLRVVPPATISGFAFKDMDDDVPATKSTTIDDEDDVVEEDDLVDQPAATTQVESSEEEEENEDSEEENDESEDDGDEEPAPPPPPPPPPTKTKTVKVSSKAKK